MTIPCSNEVRAGPSSWKGLPLNQCAVAMCINAATPAWVRVRHWSAPEPLAADDDHKPVAAPCAWDVPLTLRQELDVLASLDSAARVSSPPSPGTPASDDDERRDEHSLTQEGSIRPYVIRSGADKRQLVRRDIRLSWTQELFLRRRHRAKVQPPAEATEAPSPSSESEAVSCPHRVPDPTASSAPLPNPRLCLENESLSDAAAAAESTQLYFGLLWARWCRTTETWANTLSPSSCSYAGLEGARCGAPPSCPSPSPSAPPATARHEFKFRRKRPATATSTWPCLGFFRVTLAVLLLFTSTAQARICNGTLTIKEDLRRLQQYQDCTVFEGSVAITTGLMEKEVTDNMVGNLNFSFPALREITDYLLVYKAERIKSLADIFPNLTVIRGNKLLKDNALTIWQSTNMEDIGLSSLTKILRGGVNIMKNSRLCYVNTIDWKQIVSREFHEKIKIEDNLNENLCPDICSKNCLAHSRVGDEQIGRKLCWKQDKCQRLEVPCHGDSSDALSKKAHMCYLNDTANRPMVCDSECLGGCSGSTQEHCFSCKNVFFEGDRSGRCISLCPSPLLLYKDWRCVTKTDCRNTTTSYHGETPKDTKPYKSYDHKCLEQCPPDTKEITAEDGTPTCEVCKDCPKNCDGEVISSLDDIRRLEGCTHITGSLTIQVTGSKVVEALERYLGHIREISGYLKISRTYPIVSLNFFKNLEEIRGIRTSADEERLSNKYYSLIIMENENLQRLFPIGNNNRTVRISYQDSENSPPQPGVPFIHYNPKLCPDEIKRMLNASHMANVPDNSNEVSWVSNGDKAVCSENKLTLTVERDAGLYLMLFFDNYRRVIHEMKTVDIRALLGYEIHYTEITKATYDAQNQTKYDGRDACGGDGWKVIDHPPTTSLDNNYTNERTFLGPVKPYTYYAIFVSTLILRGGDYGGSQSLKGAQSDIVYVLTMEDLPGPPHSIVVEKSNFSSVNISWQPPLQPNGLMDHYEVIVEYKPTNHERIMDRDYCMETVKDFDERKASDEMKKQSAAGAGLIGNTTPKPDTCDCQATCGALLPKAKKVDTATKVEEDVIEDEIINRVFTSGSSNERRRRRSVSNDGAMDNQLHKKKAEDANSTIRVLADNDPRHPIVSPNNQEHERDKYNELYNPGEKKDTYYVSYSTKIPASQTYVHINKLKHFGSYTIKIRGCHAVTMINGALRKRCSESVTREVRMLHKPTADDIVSSIKVIVQNDTDSVYLSWDTPHDPNEVIVNYNIRITSKLESKSDVGRYCVTAKDFKEGNYRYKLLIPGSYYVNVQAVSVYGGGNWTHYTWVTIPGHPGTIVLSILLPLLAVIICVGSGIGYFYWRKKNENFLVSINGNYVPVDYKQDHWEVNRKLIVLGPELGKGAFGKVYKGVFNDPRKGQLDCAIKTVREDAPHSECMQFLNEAHRMKAFDTEHVVKLIGVVSLGHPNLVLMELMTNGDLKNYLRKMRPDAEENRGQQPPTERCVKQWGLEIADGMAYLSTRHKHIVHRDLAARNCMVSADLVVKVADFGMAREIYTTDYYRKGDKGLMPVRWMAPESLKDGTFTTSSDVWSFGVVLWEMVTLAELPYKGYSNQEVIETVIKGKIIDRPEGCPDDLYDLMRECWQKRESKRPTFLDICERLLPIANDEFREKSFITSAEGAAALRQQETDRAAAAAQEESDEAREETPCLMGNGSASHSNHSSNGDAIGSGGGGDSSGFFTGSGFRNLNRQSSQQSQSRIPNVTFITNESAESQPPTLKVKWSNQLNDFKSRLRHMSGSASGEA